MNESPLTISDKPQAEPVSEAVSPVVLAAPKTIVLAEDQPEVREFMSVVLRDMGYLVLEAENGEKALRFFGGVKAPTIDLLVTDIVMPVMGGKELAYRVGSLSPETKIVFASAYPEKAAARNGMYDTQIPFLQKPVSPSALQLKVKEVLSEAKEDTESAEPVTGLV